MVTVNVSRVPLQLQTSVGLCCSVHGHAHSSSDLQGTADGSCVWPQCCILWVQPMARVSDLDTPVSGYSCWLVCLPSVLQSLGTAAGSCACYLCCSRYTYSCWLVWLPSVLHSLGTAAGSCACCLCCSLYTYSCWLVCLLAGLPALSTAVSVGTAAGSCACPQYCSLWVQPMARVAAVCAAFSGHLCSLVLCPENPKATQTVKRGSCVSMGSLFCIVAGPHFN